MKRTDRQISVTTYHILVTLLNDSGIPWKGASDAELAKVSDSLLAKTIANMRVILALRTRV